MTIQWSSDLELGFKEIDQQHKEFIGALNKLYDFLGKESSKAQLANVFSVISKYVDWHFTTEEKYFDLYNYENKEEHKKEHREFEKKIIAMKAQLLQQENPDVLSLIDFMESWLVDHLDGQDKKYVECFKKNGLE